jgi:cytochrome d ubiquinol oxidase subunit I
MRWTAVRFRLEGASAGPVPSQLPLLAQAAAPNPADLMAARTQMAISLGWHIIIACFGVGFPLLAVFAEWRGVRTGDKVWGMLARRWARAMGVLFAVGPCPGRSCRSSWASCGRG